MVEIINSLNPVRKYSLIGLLVLLVVAFLAAATWLFIPTYSVLFSGLDGETAADAIGKLEERSIPFKVEETESGSVITVLAEQAEQLKVTMTADLGLPDVKGLEIFDNADYSMTDFSQDVTYKRALQGELARTISSMPGVQSARVHITFAPKRLFSADQQDAKASIFIEQTPEVKLTQAQVSGIQKLTANAIERLEAKSVSVFGFNGEELSLSDDTSTNGQIDKRLQAKYDIEQKLMEKAYRLLSLSISPEKIAVSADVTLNFDQRKKMKQGFAANADGEGVIMKQRESTVAKEGEKRKGEKDDPMMSREKETEYIHGQETEETIYSSGEISKIAVGVALREDLTDKQLKQIKDVLTAGLGINTARGDMLAVEMLNINPVAAISYSAPTVSKERDIPPKKSAASTSQARPTGNVNNSQVGNISPWWLLLLLIVPVSAVVIRKRFLSMKQREALMLEVQDWLRSEEKAHV